MISIFQTEFHDAEGEGKYRVDGGASRWFDDGNTTHQPMYTDYLSPFCRNQHLPFLVALFYTFSNCSCKQNLLQ